MVTGAAGFIGSHLVDRLLASGREVFGVDSFAGYYAREIKERNLARARNLPGFRMVEGDLAGLDLFGLLRGVDGIVHLAGEPGVRRSWGPNFSRYLENNVLCTQKLLDAAARREVGRIVHASSSSVYGSVVGGAVREDHPRRPISPYGFSKLAAENLIEMYSREKHLPVCVLRYFTVYGPRQRPEMALSRFVSAALQGGRAEVLGDGEQVREMTHVFDAVSATVAALDAPGTGTYNVGGGTRATVNKLLRMVRGLVGVDFETVYLPAARGDARETWADLGRAVKDLGYGPQVGLEEGVGSQISWARTTRLSASPAA